MDDFLTSSSMDKHNEQLLAGLSAPVAPAKKPAMMAPPMAPPPQQPYGMMAPPPAQPYGYGAPAAYGAPPPQPYGMPAAPPPAAPAPVWPPAGASQVPQAGPTYTSYQKPTAPPPAAPADPRLAGYAAPAQAGTGSMGYAAPAQAQSQASGDMLGGYDDDFFSVGGSTSQASQPARRGSAMSVASEYTEDGGNEQLTLQQPESTGSLPKYTVSFDSETKLGMLLERRAAFTPGATSEQKKARPEQTVVTMVIEGGAAAQKGVAVGSRLLLINGQDATALPYARCLEMVKSLPRPLHLVFEKSMAACDSAKGWVLVKKSAGSGPPSSMAGWQRMFFVVGGAVAKRHVLQLYSSKAQYEDIVVRMFQGQPLTGMKYKAYALSGTFKCSAIQSKVYKGEHQPVKYFALRNPYSRTKTMKFASQNPSIVAALHNHVMRFATKG
ncbi:unnamed protein product [Pelagomonas calceolata]|uniref:PDZ domain-containing protein n=2 Tax=Pelagomonas calceolata TaxID=35677 RepID=A0A8J2SXS3_9STRA|nr:unnamed protein product [Pelagomonas calceolata]